MEVIYGSPLNQRENREGRPSIHCSVVTRQSVGRGGRKANGVYGGNGGRHDSALEASSKAKTTHAAFYRVIHPCQILGWVDLDMVVPMSAQFGLGRWETSKIGRAAMQYFGI